MKKHQIRKQVAAAMKKHLPKAIADVARGKAYSAVHEAMTDTKEPDNDVDDHFAAPTPMPAVSAPMSPAQHAARAARKS